jgi:hypothetical protein
MMAAALRPSSCTESTTLPRSWSRLATTSLYSRSCCLQPRPGTPEDPSRVGILLILKDLFDVINSENAGCRCEELQSKLVKLEAKYSDLEEKYFQKEEERRCLVRRLEELRGRSQPETDCQPPASPLVSQLPASHGKITHEEKTSGDSPETPEAREQKLSEVGPSRPDINAVLKKLNSVEESRSRLKDKTKLLLRQYREKRALLERRERQLAGQRAGLQQLQLLLQSQNNCQLLVLRHVGSHLEELARLLATLFPKTENLPPLVEGYIFI